MARKRRRSTLRFKGRVAPKALRESAKAIATRHECTPTRWAPGSGSCPMGLRATCAALASDSSTAGFGELRNPPCLGGAYTSDLTDGGRIARLIAWGDGPIPPGPEPILNRPILRVPVPHQCPRNVGHLRALVARIHRPHTERLPLLAQVTPSTAMTRLCSSSTSPARSPMSLRISPNPLSTLSSRPSIRSSRPSIPAKRGTSLFSTASAIRG